MCWEIHLRQIVAEDLEEEIRRDTRTSPQEKQRQTTDLQTCKGQTNILRGKWHEAMEERKKVIQKYANESFQIKLLATLNGKAVDDKRVRLTLGYEDFEFIHPVPMDM